MCSFFDVETQVVCSFRFEFSREGRVVPTYSIQPVRCAALLLTLAHSATVVRSATVHSDSTACDSTLSELAD